MTISKIVFYGAKLTGCDSGRHYNGGEVRSRSRDRCRWTDTPGGIPGNADLGTMSAWLVWSALGMYPMTPGTATLVLGSPVFPSAVVELPSDRALRMTASGTAGGALYVRSATWNWTRWDRPYAPAGAITQGGTLDFRLATRPARGWADGRADAPPSYGPLGPAAPTGPVASSRPAGLCLTFPGAAKRDSQLTMSSCDARADQQWTLRPGRSIEAAGLCMTSVPGGTRGPARVLLESCSGAASQRWLAKPEGVLKSAATSLCLTAPRRGRVHRANAATARCTSEVCQCWKLPHTEAIAPR